jgi:catechol 2,3-dioxygenase-like lactoylglutathione lyase family enzyme
MKTEDLYHTGIVVDDLDATSTWFTQIAGHRWTEAVSADVDVETPAGHATIPMRIAYSLEEPRLELIQTAPGTLWVPADSGVHHIAYWSDDVDSDVATLQANGAEVEVWAPLPDGSWLWAYCRGPGGPRIELVNKVMQPVISQWWAAGASGS